MSRNSLGCQNWHLISWSPDLILLNEMGMSSQPFLSVCIPCYNGAPFIGGTIESVLNQSFKNFELVIADDHSSDETVSIVRLFRDPRIRLVQNEVNLGMGGNWNHVLSLGIGKYVKLLCEDDILRPGCLERQVSILENANNAQVVLTLCNRNVINHRNEVVLKKRRPIASGIVSGRELIRKSVRMGTNLIGEPAVGLFRRDAMRKKELCDPANPYLSDLSLWAELLRAGDAFIDPECLASFRISKQATSARIGLRQATHFRAFATKLRKDAFYRIGVSDLVSAYFLSFPLCLLRNAFLNVRARSGFTGSPGNSLCLSVKGSEIASPCEESKQKCHSGCGGHPSRNRACAICP